MVDTRLRRLLVGGTEDDFKVGSALIAKRGLVKEGIYAFEDIEIWRNSMHLDKVQYLQTKYPDIIVSGSIALFLHGCRVESWYNRPRPDIDLVLPYFINIEDTKIVREFQNYPSGSDFQEVYMLDGIKLDTRVDPQQRYTYVTYDGFKYKVSDPLDIIQAKIKYSKQPNGTKHRDDLYDIIGKSTFDQYLAKINGTNQEISF